LEIDLPRGLALLVGDNGQGKTNLLESIFLLATGHAHSADADREMVGWSAAKEPIPYGRVAAKIGSDLGRETTVEVVLQLTSRGGTGEDDRAPWSQLEKPGPSAVSNGVLQKGFKVNGVRQRTASSGGAAVAVFAGPEEVDLIGGPPARRRRFLDLPNWQTDQAYAQALRRHQRVLTQRNALVKQSRETGGGRPDEMDVWDGELAGTGSYILEKRFEMLRVLEPDTVSAHEALTGKSVPIRFDYQSTVRQASSNDQFDRESLRQRILSELRDSWTRDSRAGVTTVGPHRDDLRILEGEVDVGTYGSRGQQRSVALALVLAQAGYIRSVVGEEPVLLLDDPLSELDGSRRTRLLELCSAAGRQVLLTTAELELVPDDIRAVGSVFRVERGSVRAEG
jgi:DNA replication and repair protein RecF